MSISAVYPREKWPWEQYPGHVPNHWAKSGFHSQDFLKCGVKIFLDRGEKVAKILTGRQVFFRTRHE
jgi:hypothetical protein